MVQILSYLESNPGIPESLEGIVRWRLMQEQIQRTVQETQAALEWLVEKEFVSTDSRASLGVVFYSLNHSKREEIQRFLERMSKEQNLEEGGETLIRGHL